MGLRVSTNQIVKETATAEKRRSPKGHEPSVDRPEKIAAKERGDKVELSTQARQKLNELAVSTKGAKGEEGSAPSRRADVEGLVSKLELLGRRSDSPLDPRRLAITAQLASIEKISDSGEDVFRARLRLGSQVANQEVSLENRAAARTRPEDLEAAEQALERALEDIRAQGSRAVNAQASGLAAKKTRLPMD